MHKQSMGQRQNPPKALALAGYGAAGAATSFQTNVKSGVSVMLFRFLIYSYVAGSVALFAFNNYLIDHHRGLYIAGLYATKSIPAIIAVGGAVVLFGLKRISVRKSVLDILMAAWFGMALVSLIAGALGAPVYGFKWTYVAGDFLGFVMIPAVYFWAVELCRNGTYSVDRALVAFLVLALAGAAIGISKYVLVGFHVLTFKAVGLTSYTAFAYVLHLALGRKFDESLQKPHRILRRTSGVMLALLAIAVLLSARRTAILTSVLIFLSTLQFRSFRKHRIILVAVSICAVALIWLPPQLVQKAQSTFGRTRSAINVGGVNTDASTAARFTETTDIIRFFRREATFPQIALGFGAGAEYEPTSTNALVDTGDRDRSDSSHHAHFTYAVVLFRSGVIGLLVVGLVLVYTIGRGALFPASTGRLVATLGLIGIAIDLTTAQHLYYSVELPVTLAIWRVSSLVPNQRCQQMSLG